MAADRELKITEILVLSFRLFKEALRFCLPLCLLVFIPINAADLFFPGNQILSLLLEDPASILAGGAYGEFMQGFFIIHLIRLLFISLLMCGYTSLALVKFGHEALVVSNDAAPPLSQYNSSIMDMAFKKWPAVVLTGFLFYAIIFFTSVLIFPMIFFAVLFVFHRQVAATSREMGIRALITSTRLVRGFFLKRLLYIVGFALFQTAAALGLSIILGFFYPQAQDGYSLSVGASILTVGLNTLRDFILSVFTLAQAVWFVNIISVRKTLLSGNE